MMSPTCGMKKTKQTNKTETDSQVKRKCDIAKCEGFEEHVKKEKAVIV